MHNGMCNKHSTAVIKHRVIKTKQLLAEKEDDSIVLLCNSFLPMGQEEHEFVFNLAALGEVES